MDSKEFWENYSGATVTRISGGDVGITAEELYQHFAERFRRENEVRDYVTVHKAEGGTFETYSCFPIETKKDD